MRAIQLTHIGIDQSPMITDQSKTIRPRWASATTAKITPATRENVFASMSRRPKVISLDHRRATRNLAPLPLSNRSMGKKKATAAKLRGWRVSVLRSRAHYLGVVEASDLRAAEATAARTFKLSTEDRRRLAVRELD